ncbi:DNA/RNA helicase, superfamily I [Thiovulum sp. ES]|nr:DNA/RNA helicase, superfamily I [Thiovulum sp. ES]
MKIQFDDYQKKVLEQSGKKDIATIVSAVAGSGKTTTALYRAIHNNFDTERTMFVSFSNKSARDLLKRWKELSVNTRYKDRPPPYISTLHSLGVKVLRDFLKLKPIILTEWQSLKLIRTYVEEHLFDMENTYRSETTAYSKLIAEHLSKLKSRMLYRHENILNNTFQLSRYYDVDTENISRPLTDNDFNSIVKLYEEKKLELNMFDFTDLIWRTTNILSQPHHAKELNIIANLYDNITIDEVQDLDKMQWFFIMQMFRNKNALFIGDIAQSIYGFREARPDLFDKAYIGQFFHTTNELELKYNYRSPKGIVEFGNIARSKTLSTVTALAFKGAEKGSVQLKKVALNIQEGRLISQQIKSYLNENISKKDITSSEKHRQYKDIAIISRYNKYLKTVIEPALIAENIPYMLTSKALGNRMTEKSYNQLYFNIISLILNKDNIVAYIGLAPALTGIGNSFADSLSKALLTYSIDTLTTSSYYTSSNKTKLNYLYQARNQIVKITENLRNSQISRTSLLLNSIHDFIQDWCKPIGSSEERDTLEKSLSNWANTYIEDLISYKEKQSSNQTSPENTSKISSTENTEPKRPKLSYNEFEEILSQIMLELDSFSSIDMDKSDTVKLHSVHSTKGLEYPYTIVSGFNTTFEQGGTDTEEINIFYVQVSRAKNKLLIVDSNMSVRKDGKRLRTYKSPSLTTTLDSLR